MKVVLVVICLCILPTALKCEEGKVINARIDTEPKTLNGLTIYNVGKFRKFKKAYEGDLGVKKPNILGLYSAFASDPLAAGNPAEQKPRVKKVLAFYDGPSPRAKRSIIKKNKRNGEPKIKVHNKKKGSVNYSKHKQSKTLRQKSGKRKYRLKGHYSRLTGKGKRSKKSARSKSKNQKQLRNKLAKRILTKSLREKLKKKINKLQLVKKGKHSHYKAIARRQEKEKKKGNPKERKEEKHLPKKGNGRRLIAAHDALIEDYPYVVSIQKKGVHWCAGALLNQKIVITTANCLWRSNRVSRMTVRAGSRYPDRGGQVAHIAEVKTHPKWSIRSLPDNDVGLVLLDRDIRFSDNVHSVDLPNERMKPPYGDAWVTSFGTNRRDGLVMDPARSLQVYHANVLPRARCNNVTIRYGVAVSENFLCITQAGHRGPCTRDTGAPAVSDGIIWGVASWGIRKLCGTERFPAMFSYLGAPSNVEFISDALLDLMSDERHNPFPDRVDITTTTTATTTTEEIDLSTLSSLSPD